MWSRSSMGVGQAASGRQPPTPSPNHRARRPRRRTAGRSRLPTPCRLRPGGRCLALLREGDRPHRRPAPCPDWPKATGSGRPGASPAATSSRRFARSRPGRAGSAGRRCASPACPARRPAGHRMNRPGTRWRSVRGRAAPPARWSAGTVRTGCSRRTRRSARDSAQDRSRHLRAPTTRIRAAADTDRRRT